MIHEPGKGNLSPEMAIIYIPCFEVAVYKSRKYPVGPHVAICSYLVLHVPLCTCLGLSVPVFAYVSLSVPSSAYLCLTRSMRAFLCQSVSIWACLCLYGPSRAHLGYLLVWASMSGASLGLPHQDNPPG